MTFAFKADNYAKISLNRTKVMDVEGGGELIAGATVNDAVYSGLNMINVFFTDTGGWSGINYKITLNVDAPTPPTLITDNISPTTTDDAPANWLNQDVTVNLIATDNPNGSGVAHTYYSVDGGVPQTGTSLSLTTVGVHTITYWSLDKAGNIEAKHSKIVTVKLLPITSNGQLHIDDIVKLINQGTDLQKEMNGDGIFDYKDINNVKCNYIVLNSMLRSASFWVLTIIGRIK